MLTMWTKNRFHVVVNTGRLNRITTRHKEELEYLCEPDQNELKSGITAVIASLPEIFHYRHDITAAVECIDLHCSATEEKRANIKEDDVEHNTPRSLSHQ